MIEVEVTLANQHLRSSAFGWEIAEYIKHFSQTFVSGKTYGLVSELGDGAWSIACLLSGLASFPINDQYSHGALSLNGKLTSRKELQQLSCILKSTVVEEKRSIWGERTVRKQILRGLAQSHSNYSLQEIIQIFQLTPERLDRPLRQYSGEGWRASLAIGFAYGKKIFVCPWLSPTFLYRVADPQFLSYFDLVKQSGAMVVIPTNKMQWAKNLTDEVIYLESPYAHSLPQEFIEVHTKNAT